MNRRRNVTGTLVCAALALACAGVGGCNQTVENDDGGTAGSGNSGSSGSPTGTGGGGGGPVPTVPADKVDVLLVVDNSRSMADKQGVLALAVGDLIGGLANPRCVDESGQPVPEQPASPLDPCPPGAEREFAPILDAHIGVITTSIGGHGSDACPVQASSPVCGGGMHPTNDDRGHLINRQDACAGGTVPGYNGLPFLAWDPTAQLAPPGESSVASLASGLRDIVLGAGQVGCGYESQLESVYRFLADPAPYDTISVENGVVVKSGVDQVLLDQRAAFLRPDSALAIVLLSDENDCSVIEDGQFYFANQLKSGSAEFHLPRARQECSTNPSDECCKSCGQASEGCPPDPGCDAEPMLSKIEDSINLRCFDQKRRFGIDFLYPIQRYVNAFTQPMIDPAQYDLAGSAVPNPIFSDLSGSGATVRGPGLVFFAGIVGVPWQAIANDPTNIALGYKPATQLDWGAILGDPGNHVAPTDPHMIESIDPRPGLPTSGNTDPVHGHDYDLSAKRDDLQYACIFELPAATDCTDPANVAAGCDCVDPGNGNPLCDGPTQQSQARAKAYPGLRHLDLIKSLGPQGAVGSICADLSDPTSPGYGYRPAVAAVIESLKAGLVK